jgi:hypothetical protein
MIATKYYLSHHTYIGPTNYHWLFLNLVTDQYLAIERRQLASLRPWLHGFDNGAMEDEDIYNYLSPGDSMDLLSDLVTAGVFTPNPCAGKDVRQLRIPPATEVLAASACRPPLSARIMHLSNAAAALASARRSLTRESIYDIVQRISARKREQVGSVPSLTVDEISRLVAIFNSWRPFFPRDYLCLFDSLALLEFLANYGVRADWIFGATSDPFAAHCWLQQGNMLLNDSLDRVSDFCPIMTA